MKKLVPALCATVALSMLLGACETTYDGPRDRHDHDAAYVDAYYDDAYGPYNDGYWADDGYFYYRDTADHPYKRDMDKHFRRDMSGGSSYHQIRAHAKAPMGEHRDGEHKSDPK